MTIPDHERILEALNEVVPSKRLVDVELRDGRRFKDGVCEVFAGCGARVAVFHANNCILVEDITRCVPAAMDDAAADAA